jgi:hypothetical protein
MQGSDGRSCEEGIGSVVVRRLAPVLVLLLTACGPGPSTPSESPPPDAISPVPSTADLIECRDVPAETCHDLASNVIAGPHPSYAATIVHVTVTCERNPPCEPGRLFSGGRVIVRYDNETTWDQEWTFDSGV